MIYWSSYDVVAPQNQDELCQNFLLVCVWKGFMRVVVPSKGRPSSYDLVAYMNTIAASNPSFLPSTTTTAALSSLITWSCLEKFRYVVRVNQRTLNNGLSYLHMIWTIGKKCLTAFNIQCIMKVEIGRSKLCCLSSESSSKHKRKCRCHRLVFFEMTFHLYATQPTGVVILVFRFSLIHTHIHHSHTKIFWIVLLDSSSFYLFHPRKNCLAVTRICSQEEGLCCRAAQHSKKRGVEDGFPELVTSKWNWW